MTATTGTGTLIRFIFRRDRIRLLIWIAGIVGFFTLLAASFPEIYPKAEDRQARARLMENPTALAFRGPGHGLEDYTYGAMLAHELLGYAAIAVALMSIFTMVRHTRGEEESGRLELIRATVVGRYAQPLAALFVVLAANLVIALLLTLALPAVSSAYPFTGSIAFGMAVASVGICFAGIAAVTAQLTEHGRGASGMAGIVLGAAYLLRAIGDTQDGTLSWLSPFGWAQATRAFVDERWWPLALSVGFIAIAVGLAFALVNRRDVAASLWPQRPGPARASGLIQRPPGFVLRQQHGSLIGWTAGLAVVAVAFGSLGGEIEEFIADSPQLADFLAAGDATLLEAFLALVMFIMAVIATGYGVQAANQARTEEEQGHAEPLLSTALSRSIWYGSYLLVAAVGASAVLLAGAVVLGGTIAVDQRDSSLLAGVLLAAIAYLPVIWLLIGVSAVLFAFYPSLLNLIWIFPVYGAFVGLFGAQLRMPEWLVDLSPYEMVPSLPGASFEYLPVVVLTAISAALFAASLAGLQRRDLDFG